MRLATLALFLMLAACERAEPPAADNGVTTRLPPSATDGASPAEAPPPPAPAPAPVGEPDVGEPAAATPRRDRSVRAVDTVPAAYRGRWAESRAACARPHERELTVDAGRLAFWESEGRVERVRADGPDAVTIRAAFTGEGQSWTRDHRLALDDAGDRLTVTGAGAALTRVRCP